MQQFAYNMIVGNKRVTLQCFSLYKSKHLHQIVVTQLYRSFSPCPFDNLF